MSSPIYCGKMTATLTWLFTENQLHIPGNRNNSRLVSNSSSLCIVLIKVREAAFL